MIRSSPAATLLGLSAILMWSLLALLTAASGRVPPFLLAALTFAVGGGVGVVWVAVRGAWRELLQPWPVWLHGVGGLFGYHFFYFTALRNAPPVEAGLIAYLWPLLIVLLSATLPGERLRWYHIGGALLGLTGTVVIVAGAGGLSVDPQYVIGYAAAFVCAVTWATYSVMARRLAAVPTGAVTGFCLATAALSAIAHLGLEQPVWPADAGQWAAVVGLGLMPVGAAFYAWDIGMKRGDIQLLGAASYAAPLISTTALILAGFAAARWSILAAALMIVAGALLASREMISRLSSRPSAPPA